MLNKPDSNANTFCCSYLTYTDNHKKIGMNSRAKLAKSTEADHFQIHKLLKNSFIQLT